MEIDKLERKAALELSGTALEASVRGAGVVPAMPVRHVADAHDAPSCSAISTATSTWATTEGLVAEVRLVAFIDGDLSGLVEKTKRSGEIARQSARVVQLPSDLHLPPVLLLRVDALALGNRDNRRL